MRVAVTGGREFTDRQRVFEALETVHAATRIEKLIHGDCRGADLLAAEWAKDRLGENAVKPFPADWDNLDVLGAKIRRNPKTGRFYNANAGFQRNIEMLVTGEPDLLIVFPGGVGTAHCTDQALRRNIAVLSVDP